MSSQAASIYRQVLGPEFALLQPELQEYFSLTETMGRYGVGTGTFDVAGTPLRLLRAAAGVGSRLPGLPVPELLRCYERDVPFVIYNYPHLDPFGRRSLTAVRRMRFRDLELELADTTSLQQPPGTAPVLLDYLGPRRGALTDLDLSVSPEGYLRGRSRRARLFAGPLRLALPSFLAADAYAVQWWDPVIRRFRIQNKVIQRQLGTVLVYEGSFDYELRPFAGTLPPGARPQAWQSRT